MEIYFLLEQHLPADSSETLQLSQRNDEPEPATKTRDRYIL